MPQQILKFVKRWLHPVPADARSRRFVAVIECILNQNARDLGTACAPAMDSQLVQLCDEHHVGMLQMPCPEVHVLGFTRQRKHGQSIREALNDEDCAKRCQALAYDIADRIETYLKQGNELVAVLGGNPESPGCAVHYASDGLDKHSGLFMRQLQRELRQRGYDPRFLAIRDHNRTLHRQDLEALARLFAGRCGAD